MPITRNRTCYITLLPAELLTQIFTLILASPSPSILYPNIPTLFSATSSAGRQHTTFLSKPPETVLALARTCRSFHMLALKIYFSENRFSFPDTYDLYLFLHMIGPVRRSLIGGVEVLLNGERAKEAFELLGDCVQLRELYLGVNRSTTRGTEDPQKDLWLVHGVGQLRKIRGLKGLDLRVREVTCWGKLARGWYGDVFETSGEERPLLGGEGWMPWRWFEGVHVREFERALEEGLGGLREGREVGEVDDVDKGEGEDWGGEENSKS